MCTVQGGMGECTEKLSGGLESERKISKCFRQGGSKVSLSLHPQIPLSTHTHPQLNAGAPGPVPSYSKDRAEMPRSVS